VHRCVRRLYPVRVKQGDIAKGQLTAMQAAAADGLLAEAMASYVRYLAPYCDVLPEKLRKCRSEIRAELVVGHARTPDNVASLIIGLELFLGYACEIGAINREEVLAFRSGGIEVLKRRAAAQANEQHEADPVIQFMDSTQALLASGGAHLRSPDGERPIGARAYCQSKLALIMFTIDLAAALEDTGVTVTCIHPATYMIRAWCGGLE
jgi:NAD(P)-dependent dehydrogenase (short-subunit alcohol dehydrogenase family)